MHLEKDVQEDTLKDKEMGMEKPQKEKFQSLHKSC